MAMASRGGTHRRRADWPLAEMYGHARTLHFVDGPDEVHLQQIARRELRGYEQFRTVE